MDWKEMYAVPAAERQRIQELLWEHSPGSPEERREFFDPEHTAEHYVPVADGSIRVFHHRPPGAAGRRPVVFLPGWGTVPEGFADFFAVANGRIECYYVETREKNSSRLDRQRASMDMDRTAADVAEVLQWAGLNDGRDFVLMATCWGSTILTHGLAEGLLSAPTVVLFDPMYRLWFPAWMLKWVVPNTPLWLWALLRPLGKRIALWGMKEETQRRRAELFVDRATLWKWRRAGTQVRDAYLYDSMPKIRREIFVMNGVRDKIHDQMHYPRLAALAPRGRFFHLPVHEGQREQLLGLAAVLFARTSAGDPVPQELRPLERVPNRGDESAPNGA